MDLLDAVCCFHFGVLDRLECYVISLIMGAWMDCDLSADYHMRLQVRSGITEGQARAVRIQFTGERTRSYS